MVNNSTPITNMNKITVEDIYHELNKGFAKDSVKDNLHINIDIRNSSLSGMGKINGYVNGNGKYDHEYEFDDY